MSKKFESSKKRDFLKSIPETNLKNSGIATRCKFNFSYFDASQEAGQDFSDWNNNAGSATLLSLLSKVKEYTKQPLSYWREQRAGAGGLKVLSYYESFPQKTEFKHPKHVPHDAVWGRFRLGNKIRLVGFVVPEKLHDATQYDNKGNSYRFDSNTFYVVFLDENHKFYLTEKS